MYTKTARFYDAVYSWKNYEAEVEKLCAIVDARSKDRRPRTLLDVACGTGAHISHLGKRFQVEGVDLDPGMLEVARARNAGISFHEGNMVDFDLGRRFDVVTCLFSSIGYVRTLERLESAVASLARHVSPGGLVVVEPWFSPDEWKAGLLSARFIDEPDLKIARVNSSFVENGCSVIDFHYIVGSPSGVESFVERHELGLWSVEEYLAAFRACGLDAQHDREGISGRGLYVASPRP